MRNQIAQRQVLLSATTAIVFILGAFTVTIAQDGGSIGAKYGTRDPRTCENTKAPARGAITAALAVKYFICAAEEEDGRYLYLVENVKVQVGAGRPYNRNMDINVPQVDVRFPLYPIRGSHTKYQCNPVSDYYEEGKNCNRYEHQNAKGFCYRTTFGDWRCYQADQYIPTRNEFFNVPGPGGRAAANNPAGNVKTPQAATTTAGNTNVPADENGIVKPDFSELEKDYEIVSYEYDNSVRPPAIYMIARVERPNSGTIMLNFEGRFNDANGTNLMIPAERVIVLSGDPAKVGDTLRLRVWTASDSQMRNKVKKIAIVRIN